MARLNTRPSSRYASATPGPGNTSDQENHDPQARMDKGKGRARAIERSSLPTPTSGSSNDARGQKRKRVQPQSHGARSEERDEEDEEDGDEDDRDTAKFVRYFDPNQDPEVRRDIKRKSRALEREFQESRDDLLRDSGKGLSRTIRKANDIYKSVKQTNDATLDSRLLVNVSDLAYKKTAQLVVGDSSVGVDVDEFLSKCITFMQNGGPLNSHTRGDVPSTLRRPPARNRDDSDDEEEEDVVDTPLDWELFGRHACFPHVARPCVPSFLLGPLSVEKKHRTQTQRRARQSGTSGREARPETLSREELSHSDENGLKAICIRILSRLKRHVQRAEEVIDQAGFQGVEELHTARGKAILKEVRVTDTGYPSLFDFVLNPRSFGQTIENLFYVSFLIKEGQCGIHDDSEGLPTIVPSRPSSLEDQRKNKTGKHQAVFSLDYATWQELVDAFDVREPLIEHRQENDEVLASTMGARGWYT